MFWDFVKKCDIVEALEVWRYIYFISLCMYVYMYTLYVCVCVIWALWPLALWFKISYDGMGHLNEILMKTGSNTQLSLKISVWSVTPLVIAGTDRCIWLIPSTKRIDPVVGQRQICYPCSLLLNVVFHIKMKLCLLYHIQFLNASFFYYLCV